MSIEQAENQSLKISIADKLSTALFIEYGDEKDNASQMRLNNLALDMVEVVSNNSQKESSELLVEVKQSDGYRKLVVKTDFDDDDMLGYISNIKKQLEIK